MKVRIWGCRGSMPTPLMSQEVEEKIVQAIHDMPAIDTRDAAAVRAYVQGLPILQRGTAGGNTSCVEVQAGGETLIVDAGTGIRGLGLELMKGPCGRGQGRLHILFSHPHWDHIQGFPLFLPAFVPGNQITFYSVHDLQHILTEQQRYAFFPVAFDAQQAARELAALEPDVRQQYGHIPYMQAQREFVRLEPGAAFSIGAVRVHSLRNHHPGHAYSYRFEDQHSVFVYASDAEYKALDAATFQRRVAFFKDADALLFDAQYGLRESWESKVDYGHSSAMIGLDFARRAGVKKLLLTHHEPTYSDRQLLEIQETAVAYQAQDASLPTCEVLVAYEGLELDLAPAGAVGTRLLSDGEGAVLTPTSVFDQRGVDQLLNQLALVAKSDSPLGSIVDLSQVEQLTTASLKTLVTSSRQRDGAPVVLAAPSPAVRAVIELAGYGDYFAIYPSVDAAARAVQAREALNLPGQTIAGRYQIVDFLGRSALGPVLKVVDQADQRELALRVLSPAFETDTVERFAAHVERVLQLDHPRVARVYGCDRDPQGDYAFVVEELLQGPTLFQRLHHDTESLAWDQALDLALEITQALEHAHSRGVVHGNLKLQDVFLTRSGVKVSGFALGRLEEGRTLLEAPMLFSTASHLAPEQILGHPLDARSDLYALGVIMYQLFAGQPPFQGAEHEVLQAHLEQAPTPPRHLNPALSRSLEHLVLKLLAKNPNERYASAQQVRQVANGLASAVGEAAQPVTESLVGRDGQLQTLAGYWEEAKAGQGQLAFITGELGIGKTSLAQQMAAQVDAPVVLMGRCQPQEGGPAFHPFAEALQAYLATVPPELSDPGARPLISHFRQLVPDVSRIIPDLPAPPELEPQQAQLRLISSLAQFIKEATRRRPWVLILDDLQWADESSVEALRYLGRQLPEMSLMVVGTYRELDVANDHPLRAVLRDLGQRPFCHLMPIDRLAQADVARVLGDLWDPTVPQQLAAAIYQRTEGNPLYVHEVARALIDDGLVKARGGQWLYPDVESVRLPQSVYEAIEGRIHYLVAETRDVLSQAAVLGQSFAFEDLVAMSGLPEGTVLDHLDLALERQLVQEVASAELRFRHAEIHHVIYNDLGRLRRRSLHRRAGDAIERRARPQPEQRASELAHHFAEAGELQRALPYGAEAARQAQADYANASAVYWYEQVLSWLDRLDAGQSQESFAIHFDSLLNLGHVLELSGAWEAAGAQYEAARALAAGSGVAESLVYAQIAIGELYRKQGNLDEAEPWFAQALETAERLDYKPGVAKALSCSGVLAVLRGDYAEAQASFERSLAIRRELQDRHYEAILLNNLAINAANQGDSHTAQALFTESLALRRELGDKWEIANSLNNLGQLNLLEGRHPQAQQYLEEALAILREIGVKRSIGLALLNLANVQRGQGQYTDARVSYRESLQLARELGDQWLLAYLLDDIGGLLSLQGQAERGLRLAGAGSALHEATGAPLSPPEEERLAAALAPARAALGEEAAAAAWEAGRSLSLEEAVNLALSAGRG